MENNGFYRFSEFNVSMEYYEGKVYDLIFEGIFYYFVDGILIYNFLYFLIVIIYNVLLDMFNREGCKEYDVVL